MLRSRIAGLGGYVPTNIVTNDDLSKKIATDDEWIQKRSGIKQRHWVKPGEQAASDLALEATNIAIEDAGIAKEDIELIIFATLSPDHSFPGSGCFLQAKLGIPGVPALDIRQQCSGFLYGLSIADMYIRSGQYKTILLVGAEVHSTGLDVSDEGRDVAVLFGDGAGATILQASEVSDAKSESYIWETVLHADGRHASELWLQGPGSAYETWSSKEQVENKLHFPQMNGKKVFIHAIQSMSKCLGEQLAKNNLTVDDIDMFFFHQANLRINQKVAEMLGIPEEKCFTTIDRFANTTAATIPLGMATAKSEGVLKEGMLIASAAFGSGFTWGSSIFRV